MSAFTEVYLNFIEGDTYSQITFFGATDKTLKPTFPQFRPMCNKLVVHLSAVLYLTLRFWWFYFLLNWYLVFKPFQFKMHIHLIAWFLFKIKWLLKSWNSGNLWPSPWPPMPLIWYKLRSVLAQHEGVKQSQASLQLYKIGIINSEIIKWYISKKNYFPQIF